MQRNDLYLLKHKTHPAIELVKPYEENSPINNYLKESDNNIYHYCYEVFRLKEVEKELKKQFRFLMCQSQSQQYCLIID